MTWEEFQSLLSSLPSDCQLVQIIGIRKAEGDELENLTQPQKQIRDDWYSWISENQIDDESSANQLEMMFKSICRG